MAGQLVAVFSIMYSLVQWNWFSDVTGWPEVPAYSDDREPISLHQAVLHMMRKAFRVFLVPLWFVSMWIIKLLVASGNQNYLNKEMCSRCNWWCAPQNMLHFQFPFFLFPLCSTFRLRSGAIVRKVTFLSCPGLTPNQHTYTNIFFLILLLTS